MVNSLEELKTRYSKWCTEQKKKAFDFYADPFTGKVEDENYISYVHKFTLGGTVDAALLGKSKWHSKQDMYDQMLTFAAGEEKFVFDRGHALEQFVADQFSKLTHIKHKNGISAHNDDYPWSYCQIDRLTIDGTPLEIKTAGFSSKDGMSAWGRGCEFNSKGDLLHEDNQIPEDYYVQCQKQLWLTAKDYMYLCAWILTDVRVRVYIIHRDEDMIEQIKNEEIDFLFNHVIPQVPYEDEEHVLDTVDEAPDCVYADESFVDLCRQYKEYGKQKLNAEKQQKSLGEQIKALMGEHLQAISSDGSNVCKLTPQSRLTLDSKGLADKYPEQYKEFYKSVPISSKLTIAKEI